METIISLVILLILLLGSAFFSGSETALFSLPHTKLLAYESSKDSRKRLIARLLKKPKDLLVTVFMMNVLINILFQNVVSGLAGPEASWLYKVVLPFAVLLICGEIIPKYIGLQQNVRFAEFTAPLTNFFQNLLKPIRRVTVAITVPISNALFFYLRKEQSISRDELKLVLKKSEEVGVLEKDESELVWGYLNLQDASVWEVMRPREEIIYYDITEPLTKLMHLFTDQQCTRIPVCEGDLQNMLGIISARRFFINRPELEAQTITLRSCLAKATYVPESTQAKVLLRRMDLDDQEIALVVDEYGAISGLITYEDLVEVVVGKIVDMRDKKQLYTRSGPNEIITNSTLGLDDFNELFDVELNSENGMKTIGGWLIERHGNIPKSGTEFDEAGFHFRILSADNTRIKQLHIRKTGKGSAA